MSSLHSYKIKITTFWAILVILSAVYLYQNLIIVSDIVQFMPTDTKNKKTQVVLNQVQKSVSTNLVFAQISSSNTQDAANISQQLKLKLTENKHLFAQVINSPTNFNASQLQLILKHRYLLTQPSGFSVATLKRDFNHLLDSFRSGAPDSLIEYLRLDPQKRLSSYLSPTQVFTPPKTHSGVWFVRNNALVVVKLNDMLNVKEKSEAIVTIENTFQRISNTAEASLLLSGASVVALESRQHIQNTIQQASWVLIVIIFFVFGFLYRSIYLAFLASIPLGISIIITMAITQAIFGQIHGIVLAFGITALGVCLDYALHLFSHLHKDESPISTFKRIWPVLKISALSSILAYMSLVASGFDGLTQLAVFASLGLFIALMVSRSLLSAWVKKDVNIRYIALHKPLSLKIKLISSVVLIIAPLVFLSTNNGYFSTNIDHINPISSKQREVNKQLQSSLAVKNSGYLFLVSEPRIQAALIKTQALKKALQVAVNLNMIGGSLASSDLLPSHQAQRHYQTLLPNKILLQKQVANAIKGMPFKSSAFDQFIRDVEVSKTARVLDYQDIESSIIGQHLQALLFEKEGIWYSIIKPFDIKNEIKFVKWVENNAQLQPYYYSTKEVLDDAINSYQHSTWARLATMLLILILIVMWWAKTHKHRIWVIAPVLSGVLMSLAFQVILGHSVNIFHLLSLLLIIGMGIDYGLFFNQPWHNKQQRQQRTHAVTISAITTVTTFLVLALSDIVVLSSIGQMVVVGIISSFVCAKYLALPPISPKMDL